MKQIKLLSLFLIAISISSCVTINKPIDGYKPAANKTGDVNNFNRSEYVLNSTVSGQSKSIVLWVTFIPMGNPAKETRVAQRAYRNAVKTARKNSTQPIDGIVNPQYTTTRVIVPLLLVNFAYKKVVCEGKSYRLKTDEELED
ncbi:MAG: hypothetical protein LBN27_11775 [Prevotellaceae bacterium]|jgi:hypothetical protein|nr:hypothetical protein [Prevotellaceae bacterium]